MNKGIYTYRLVFCLFLTVFFSGVLLAQYDIPEKPKKSEQKAVYDKIDLLSKGQQTALQNKLENYADSTSTQIVVYIISTTKGEDISLLGARWGHAWGIGQADEDNGIFILLAKDDRTVDINTGYGIEYLISDRDAERIINRIMVPNFKNGNFYEGLDKATDAMFAYLNGEYTEDREFGDNKVLRQFLVMLIFFILFIALTYKKNGRGGGNGGGGSLLDVIILSNMGRSDWGGGSSSSSGGGWSSGGGFGGGFGGGGFGGGGASGSW
ncbi:TPM domain-containing protein [Aureisphaera galaxeae]|uniref:TPM domain-containing protein n=1 Tax=Aureisphaera galaxeae TaxID=1538023 RepID=UPI00235106C1|nr:TPM domain-containing protein [Aureisphaera galaxeae]MDC8003122.1 TPM domain-containing protein [Aureisphaera galaxeae]